MSRKGRASLGTQSSNPLVPNGYSNKISNSFDPSNECENDCRLLLLLLVFFYVCLRASRLFVVSYIHRSIDRGTPGLLSRARFSRPRLRSSMGRATCVSDRSACIHELHRRSLPQTSTASSKQQQQQSIPPSHPILSQSIHRLQTKKQCGSSPPSRS